MLLRMLEVSAKGELSVKDCADTAAGMGFKIRYLTCRNTELLRLAYYSAGEWMLALLFKRICK